MNLLTIKSWKEKAKQLKTEIRVLYLASKDSRVPWYSKVLVVVIIGYALSPIDLIPDFIPVLGYVDDLILIPLGIYFALKMIPGNVLDEYREKAKSEEVYHRPNRNVAAFVIILVWLLVICLILRLIWQIVF